MTFQRKHLGTPVVESVWLSLVPHGYPAHSHLVRPVPNNKGLSLRFLTLVGPLFVQCETYFKPDSFGVNPDALYPCARKAYLESVGRVESGQLLTAFAQICTEQVDSPLYNESNYDVDQGETPPTPRTVSFGFQPTDDNAVTLDRCVVAWGERTEVLYQDFLSETHNAALSKIIDHLLVTLYRMADLQQPRSEDTL